MKLFWRKFFPFLFLLSLSVLFFLPYLLNDKIPYSGDFTGSDLTELNLPFRVLAGEQWRDGQIPLWTQRLATGFPLLAEGQAGIFYAPTMIFFTWLPVSVALVFSLILHFFLAGVLTYWLCRVYKISKTASLIAGIVFAFGGFFIFRIKHLNMINAAIWFPLQILLIEYYLKKRWRLVVFAGLVLVFVMQFFAGHPQISYIAGVATFFYFILRFFQLHPGKLIRNLFHISVFWITLSALSLGLAAIQFLPNLEFFKLSSRTGMTTLENATMYAYHPAQLLTFFNPFAFGNPATATYLKDIRAFGIFWESNIYLGILPLLFALIALIVYWRKKQIVRTYGILILISYFFIFGKYNPLFGFVWSWFPGLKLFRFPQRFLLPVTLAMSVVAGFGADLLWQRIKKIIQRRPSLGDSYIIRRGIVVIVFLVIIIDIFLMSSRYLGMLSKSYFSPPQSAEFIQEESGEQLFRVYSHGWLESWQQVYLISEGWLNNLELYETNRQLLQPNTNAYFGIDSVTERGWVEAGQLFRQLADFQSQAKAKYIQYNQDEKVYEFSSSYQKLLGMQNVRYITSFFPIQGEGLELRQTYPAFFMPPLLIYENTKFLPRAFAVSQVIQTTNDAQALELLLDPEFDPSTNVIITGNIDDIEIKTGKAQVNNIDWQANQITMDVDFDTSQLLFLSQAYHPGWQARVDGESTEIYRANHAFQAIYLSQGQHDVIFTFRPSSFIIGRLISLASLVVVFLIIGYGIIYERRRGRGKT